MKIKLKQSCFWTHPEQTQRGCSQANFGKAEADIKQHLWPVFLSTK